LNRSLTTAFVLLLGSAVPLYAHPHVFVDGGVDFIMADEATLDALSVTWLFDEFETLYDLASRGIEPQADGSLSEADREIIRAAYAEFPDDFDGSAHLTIDGKDIEMDWPSDVAVNLADGRLQLTFIRKLADQIDLTDRDVDVALYESTYFFAFTITNQPTFSDGASCTYVMVPYVAGSQTQDVQQSLAQLGREETPQIANVGELFADRIVATCAS
jgi:ABC-type uncharacterized transport system substrate-binding protein